MKQKIEMER